jgi:hypothetical protein
VNGGLFRLATIAGVVGLFVLHADAVATIASKAIGTFRGAVRLA